MHRAVILFFVLCSQTLAHQMTPAHIKFGLTHIDGVKKARMEIFNSRSDVEFYEIGVFDINWKAIPFVSAYKIIKIPHLSRVKFDVYLTEADSLAAEYLCSLSKLRGDTGNEAMLATKICSRFK